MIIEDGVILESAETKLDEAQSMYDKLSSFLNQDEIKVISQNLVEEDSSMAVCLAAINEKMDLHEFIVKHVDSKGEVTKKKDLKTRKREAYQTTGLSKATRRDIARKAAKTKKANPSILVKANKKKAKAMKKRKMLGL